MDTVHSNAEGSSQSLVDSAKSKIQSLYQQFKESTQFKCDRSFTVKATFIAVFGTFLILNGIFGIVMPRNPNIDCVDDKLMTLTDSFNSFFANNNAGRHALIIIGSLSVDIVFVFTVLYWVLFGKSWRLMVTYLMFSIVKVFSQAVFQFELPDGYIWDDPGFPSLLVNYQKAPVFFYSSYVGVPVICGLEWRKNGCLFFMVVCFAVACFESFTVFVTRVHFSIDIISGIVFAHYFYILSDTLFAKYVDESFFALEKKSTDVEKDILTMEQQPVEQLLV